MTNVTITGTDVTVTVDGTTVFPAGGSMPKPPNPNPGPDPGGKLVIGANAGIMWGTNIHPIQGGSPYASIPIDVLFQMAQDLGLKRLRLDLYEASDRSQTLLASALAESAVRGVEVLPIIIPGYDSYRDEQDAYNACKPMLQTYASNFKQVLAWELGNEYELSAQTGGQGTKIGDYDYNKYLKARGCYRGMIEGMKAGNPYALSCIDTSGHGHYGWTDELWKDGIQWDITGEHFYSDKGNVDIRHLYLEVGEINKLQLLKEHYGKPVWMTEFNYWGGDQPEKAQMAQYLTKTMAEYDGFAKEYLLEAVDIYEMMDEPQISGREALFGLYTGSAPNAAGEAVKAYLQAHPSKSYQTVTGTSTASSQTQSSGSRSKR